MLRARAPFDLSSPWWLRSLLSLAAVLAALVLASPALARAAGADEGLEAKGTTSQVAQTVPALEITRKQPALPPSALIQLSAAAGGGAKLAGTDLLRGDKSVDEAIPMFEVTGELRVLSFAGLRGGVVMTQGEGPTETTVRGGFALHFLSSKSRPDLYLLTDLAWNATATGDEAGSRGLAVGMGFRVRMGRHVVLGVEGAFAHDGIPAGDDNPFPQAAQRILLGETIDPQVSAHLGFVL